MGTIIEQISVAAPGRHGRHSALDLAVGAAKDCLRDTHRVPNDVDLLINAGLYRDRNLGEPALAALIQEDVGAHPEDPHLNSHGTFSFDVANGICGVLTAAQIADGFLRSGAINQALVVASDADPGPHLSDDFPFKPAGAAMLCTWTANEHGFGKFYWASEPDGGDSFRSTVGLHFGRNMLRFNEGASRIEAFSDVAAVAVKKCLEAENVTVEQVDVIITAPGDDEFRAALAKRIGARRQDIVGIDNGSHTSALLFSMHSTIDSLPPGSVALLVAAGAGVTAGAVLYRTGIDESINHLRRPTAAVLPNHLTPLDAAFLEIEDADEHVSLAIGGVTILEGPPPVNHQLLETLSRRITAIPRYRQIVRFKPLDLGAPEWIDDPDFDFANHLYRTALPAPGDDAALYDFVAETMRHRLDRERPLWECWVVEGLSRGRWAMLVKVHHCIADGISSTRTLASLCDEGDVETFADRIQGDVQSHQRTFPAINPLRWPGQIARGSIDAATELLRTAKGAADLASSTLFPSAPSSLNGSIAKQRRFGAAKISLDDLEEVRRAFDVTINDVALAAISEAYRGFLLRRGETPRPDTLRTLVPVSVRTSDVGSGLDNRVSLMLPLLPVDISDPVERLRAVHARMVLAKSSGQKQAGSSVIDAAKYLPFMFTAKAVRLLTHFPQRGVVALATNVPGPSRRLHLLGREVLEMMPVPPIAMRLRTGIAMLSYADTLTMGITADHDAAPDVAELAAEIERAVKRLVDISRRGRGQSPS